MKILTRPRIVKWGKDYVCLSKGALGYTCKGDDRVRNTHCVDCPCHLPEKEEK
jgi:hypothetical protein